MVVLWQSEIFDNCRPWSEMGNEPTELFFVIEPEAPDSDDQLTDRGDPERWFGHRATFQSACFEVPRWRYPGRQYQDQFCLVLFIARATITQTEPTTWGKREGGADMQTRQGLKQRYTQTNAPDRVWNTEPVARRDRDTGPQCPPMGCRGGDPRNYRTLAEAEACQGYRCSYCRVVGRRYHQTHPKRPKNDYPGFAYLVSARRGLCRSQES